MVHCPLTSHCLSSYTPHRSLRSSSGKLLCVPRVNLKSAGARSFQYQAPCLWNSVPIQTRFSTSLTSFKSSLKTHLFRNAFTWVWNCHPRHGLVEGWWWGRGGGGGLLSMGLTGKPAAAATFSSSFLRGIALYKSYYYYLLKWACPLQIPNNRQLYHSLDTQKYCPVNTVKILNKNASFTTKCITATERVTENVWLTPALMDEVTE